VLISALVMGTVAFAAFYFLMEQDVAEEVARNQVLLLMILFENVHVFNSRSETCSVFRHSLLSNPFLVLGTLGAQALHIAAMYTPGLSTVLQIQPVTLEQWSFYLMLGMSALLASEMYKLYRRYVPLPLVKVTQ
jgi:magnesium-transporting ATPase (P-type)